MDRRRLSKAMAYHLRHGDQVAQLPGGWARVDELRKVLRPRPSRSAVAAVAAVVSLGDKPRFKLSGDGELIRARYGHSREVDLQYAPAGPPGVLYHGTAAATVPALLSEGIRRQGRRYVHLSEDVATARRVGARHGTPVVVRVAAAEMAGDGHRFFHAAAGMWLTSAVPAAYLAVER